MRGGQKDAARNERPRAEDVEPGALRIEVGEKRTDLRMEISVRLSERDGAGRAGGESEDCRRNRSDEDALARRRTPLFE